MWDRPTGARGRLLKVLTVVGARPQFIKAVVVSRAMARYNETAGRTVFEEVLVHTGQHFDLNMSDIFFTELKLTPPAYHLGVGGINHSAMTGRMLERIDAVIAQETPDAVLVYGDTNSTLAGALAAVKRHVPVAHVEAGLRSFDRRMPEEINRLVTDRVSSWLFCPTTAAVENLRREGITDVPEVRVVEIGDVMYDASLTFRTLATPTERVKALIEGLGQGYYVATVHREENVDGPGQGRLQSIVSALERIARTTPVVMPLHPRARKALPDWAPRNIQLLDPVGYLDMIVLLSGCRGVITDSGGLQKEAYFFGKPCITLRDQTEWVELVEHGFNVLVGADRERILAAERAIRDGLIEVKNQGLYGNGDAGKRVVEVLAASGNAV
jgi:UDP-GlcNAc3NAcA epimerase